MADTGRMPHEGEARGFKTAVLQAAAEWLGKHPGLDRAFFQVDVAVDHRARAEEDLDDYFKRDTGDEAK